MATAAACSKLKFAGLGRSRSARADAYSAKEPRQAPNTSSPGWTSVTLSSTVATLPAT